MERNRRVSERNRIRVHQDLSRQLRDRLFGWVVELICGLCWPRNDEDGVQI